MADVKKYNWRYCSIGGVTRVILNSGEDIAHIDELDQKLWTVLSCPVSGFEFDKKTLDFLDADKDGKIKVPEVVSASKWLTRAIKDKDLLLKSESSIDLDQFDTSDELGNRLHDSSVQILKNLGCDKNSISIEDTSDSVAIFSGTGFNGDGIITALSTDDEALKSTIQNAIDTIGNVTDRSGEQGINAAIIENFYTACTNFDNWNKEAEQNADSLFPYGKDSGEARSACEAVKNKIADFFIRCKLVSYNNACENAVDVSIDKISGIADKNLTECTSEIADYPLAKPNKEGLLHFDAINPAWQEPFNKLRKLVFDREFPGKDSITEEEWLNTVAKFEPYANWLNSINGGEVEAMGIERVREILAQDKKQSLLELVAKDEAVKKESESIDDVNKFLHLYRDFYHFLRNYITFSDLYDSNPSVKAVFQAGELYIDQRCCKLCIEVSDMSQHGDMAGQSGMFLIYCTCTSRVKNETKNIVAVMTDGDTYNLRVGKNAIFYDRDGHDWDATVTKIVDNPISIRQAFWRPYIKFANFISEKINKSAAEKENNVMSQMEAKADAVPTSLDEVPANPDKAGVNKKSAFDIAKFAGIFAAIGMAVGYIGSFLESVAKGVAKDPFGFILILLAIVICISGPSCFIAWGKLRKRNLGPVLNANGWAMNSVVLINIIFGGTLTSKAKYPVVKGKDPYVIKRPLWKKIIRWLIFLAAVAFATLFFTNNLKWMGIERSCKGEKVVVESEAIAEEPTNDGNTVEIEDGIIEEAAE